MAGSWLPDPDSPDRKLVQLKVDNYGLPIKMLRSSESNWRELISKLQAQPPETKATYS